MLKRIFILVMVFFISIYTFTCITVHLANKESVKSYDKVNNDFDGMLKNLRERETLNTRLAPKQIIFYIQAVINEKNYSDAGIRPEMTELYKEKSKDFEKQLRSKKLSYITNEPISKGEEKNNLLKKGTMSEYFEVIENGLPEEELLYFIDKYKNIKDEMESYKNCNLEIFIKTISILSLIILFGCIFGAVMICINGDLSEKEVGRTITYSYIISTVIGNTILLFIYF